ncbi:MAG: hypothetical protein KAT53_07115, partial [Dehalococcoidia bacterium]|nr:hypothetical protein [Dehalococcoidia bacterium]
LLCNAIIKNTGSAALYARAEVRQDSRDLLAKFEAQDIQVLYAKGEVRQADLGELYAKAEVGQGSGELFAKAVVGQGSVELIGRGIIRNVGSADLLGKFEAQATVELLGRAVIGHPAFPVWLKAIFSIGLTNAHRDLGSNLRIKRTAFTELLGRFEAQASAELLGKAVIRNIGSAELLGKAVIRHMGTAETLSKAVIRGLSSADLGASVIVRVTKDSGTYFSFWDPSDWINEVVGVGQGFIAIPWVEADADVKTSGNSSARLTSASSPGQYKEIRFGWGGMNWSFEAAVSPEIAPTPIDTDGRGPRRGSRASRDWRREVLQSSYKDLAGRFVTQAINDLGASFFAMVNYTSWTLAWTRDYGAAVALDGVYVDNSGNCYITDAVNKDVYFRSYAGVETSRSDYLYMVPRREELPVAISEGEIRYIIGENDLVFDQFDIWRDGAIVASINPVTDLGADFDGWRAMDMSDSGKYIAFVVEGLSNKYYL